MLKELSRVARGQGGVVSIQQLEELGCSPQRRRTLKRRGSIVPFHGSFLVRCECSSVAAAQAHAVHLGLRDRALLTGAAAARLQGCEGNWPTQFDVAHPLAYAEDCRHLKQSGVTVLRRAFDGEVFHWQGIRLADRVTALLDCIDFTPAHLRVDLMDYFLQRRWMTAETVGSRIARRQAGRRGRRTTRAQRAACKHASAGTMSHAERLLAKHLRAARLDGWKANHGVVISAGQPPEASGDPVGSDGSNPHGEADRRGLHWASGECSGSRFVLDFAWPAQRVAIEMDGRAHHSSDEAFERDRERQNQLHAAGWLLLRVTWRSLTADPPGTIAMIRRVLASRCVQAPDDHQVCGAGEHSEMGG